MFLLVSHFTGKEARKRELKKVLVVLKPHYVISFHSNVMLIFYFICDYVYQNKKQRMMVRAAVLKMKDPRQIIRDMEKLDEMG